MPAPNTPSILTTTVGSYPVLDWLVALPSEQAVADATRVIFDIQRQAGIDLPTDGELYRFDINHPDTNGMIDYFVSKLAGCRTGLGRSEEQAFRDMTATRFRAQPAAVVEGELGEGSLNLLADCRRAAQLAAGPFKFTVTSPYMLARTLLDGYYRDFEELTLALAGVIAEQVHDLPCDCLQIDEANIPGNPDDAPLAAEAINLVLDAVDTRTTKAVHFCFGNYGGQTIQKGNWRSLTNFLNSLHCDHLVLELAHRPANDIDALADIDPQIGLGIGVIDVKVNHIETPDEVAKRIQAVADRVGPDRIQYVHPDCGFWMLKRSIADRKMINLVKGRNLFQGIN